jgi:phosphatidylglycerol---prolipoprotein diacylglyceryl transferase
MWPALFRIPIPTWFPDFLQPQGNYFPIRMFGVMVITGFLAGYLLIKWRLRKVGVLRPTTATDVAPPPGTLTKEDVFDFCFYLLAAGILGSRLMYVAQNFDQFRGGFFEIFKIWKGGLVWYGGFALATLFGFWWLWQKKLPVLKVVDALALGVALGLALGRWGCFFAGDDYGRQILDPSGAVVTDAAQAPWYAIRVPSREDLGWRFAYTEFPVGQHDMPDWTGNYLHAVQLYMSFKNLVVLALLLVIASRARRHGVVAASYLLLYPVGRFVIEFFRGDEDRGVNVLGTGLSFSQFFGIFVFLAGMGLLRAVKAHPPEPAPVAAK